MVNRRWPVLVPVCKLSAILLVPMLLNRVALVALQQESAGFVRGSQVLVGLANDGFVVLLMSLAFLLFVAMPKGCLGWIPKLALIFVVGFIFTATLVNAVYVAFYHENLGLHDFGYAKDLPLVLGSPMHVLRLFPLQSIGVISYTLAVIGIGVWGIRLVGGRSWSELRIMILAVVVSGLGFRTTALSFRHVLYEPVETHIIPYLAWRMRLDGEHDSPYPREGFKTLTDTQAEMLKSPLVGVPELSKKTNVVFVLIESFGLAAIDRNPAIAPFMVKMLSDSHSVVFDQHFTSSYRTVGALYSSMCSLYDPSSFYVIRDYPRTVQHCLPALLRRSGFATSFVSGSRPEFDYIVEWSARNGMDQILSANELPQDETFSFGVHDQAAFQALSDVLDREPEPFFSHIRTVSNHYPYDIPTAFLTAHPEVAAMTPAERGYYYTDWQLQGFFARAQNSKWFENTLFVLIGDHPQWDDYRLQGTKLSDIRSSLRVAALLWHQGFKRQVVHEDTSHVDIVPTLLALLGVDAGNVAGLPIWSTYKRQYLLSQPNPRDTAIYLHNSQVALRYDIKSGQCLRLTASHPPMPCSGSEELAVEGHRQSYLETTSWVVRHGSSRG